MKAVETLKIVTFSDKSRHESHHEFLRNTLGT